MTRFNPAKRAWPADVVEIQEIESASQKAVAQYALTVLIIVNLVAGKLHRRRRKSNGNTVLTDTAIWRGLAKTKSPWTVDTADTPEGNSPDSDRVDWNPSRVSEVQFASS